MVNKQPTYKSIKEWVDTLKDYKLETVYFSITTKPKVRLKSNIFWDYDPIERKELEAAFNQEVNRLMIEHRVQQAEFDIRMMKHKLFYEC